MSHPVGGSHGGAAQATSEDFARDVLAGVEYLLTRREIDPNRIGLIGHSDGGNIAPLAAVDSNDVAFIVLMAGSGVTGDLVLEGQIAALLKVGGADQATIDAAIQDHRRRMDVIKNETDPNLAQEKLRAVGVDSLSRFEEKQRQAIPDYEGYVDSQVQMLTSRWYYFFVTHDPRETLREVKCPVLALNGELDLQVLAKVNLPVIEQALREGGNPDFTVKELPRLNHLFQTAETGAIEEYARIDETLSPLALETIGQWIEGVLPRGRQP
ncbi:MAG: hypothetical protein A2Y77_00685 [Planctomycetes bacterium RBG_13_62_9]|nr:MAG: hypothetical protein A2Y77_00685 [Planctomycetes bacterium RBG_13_62_9]